MRDFQLSCLALISSVFLCAGVAQSQAVPDTVGAATSGYRFSIMHSFCQSGFPCTDGVDPSSTLVRDAFGNLYGTTAEGGTGIYAPYGAGGGTVFKVDSTGHETVLYSFCSTLDCKDGNLPGALVRDAAGNLYGITSLGGTNNLGQRFGGIVYKLNAAGQQTLLHSFCSQPNCADGTGPASLILDSAGNLYGTTGSGGAYNSGMVFKLDGTGKLTILYSFCSQLNCVDGNIPSGRVIWGATGSLYGTTMSGGANNSGVVFKLDSAGHETVLYSFCSAANCTDGAVPDSGVILDAAGNLYGTTSQGGAGPYHIYTGGSGVLFKLNPRGVETVLHNFCSLTNCADGEYPGGLFRDAAGNFFGTTISGGNIAANSGLGGGTVFKLNPIGQLTVLHSFCTVTSCADGAPQPRASLIQDAAGNLYGAGGTVFKLTGSAWWHRFGEPRF
jgi:uncharacterized repeat protein (TIGR03803 family)